MYETLRVARPLQRLGIVRGAAIVTAVALCAGLARADSGSERYGVLADVGVPDGAVAAFAFRVHPQITTHAGLGHNANGPGLRVGVQLAPFVAAVAPYLALTAGHYFRAETPEWLKETAKDAGLDDKSLERLGYQFFDAHLGARFGAATSFYVQAGVSFIRATADIIKPKPTYVPPVDLYRETTVHIWALSGQAGMVFYF